MTERPVCAPACTVSFEHKCHAAKPKQVRRSVLLVGAFNLFALPAAAQQQIGMAHGVTPAAHGSVAGTLASGSGVHADETIGTDKAGKAGLRFHDQSWTSIRTRA